MLKWRKMRIKLTPASEHYSKSPWRRPRYKTCLHTRTSIWQIKPIKKTIIFEIKFPHKTTETRGPWAEPLVRESGGETPLTLKGFRHYTSKGQAIFAPLPNFWKCWNIYQTLHSRPTVHKQYTHSVNVNRLNCRTRSASHVQNHTVRSNYLAIIRQ